MLLELYDRNHKKLANLTGIKSPHIQRNVLGSTAGAFGHRSELPGLDHARWLGSTAGAFGHRSKL